MDGGVGRMIEPPIRQALSDKRCPIGHHVGGDDIDQARLVEVAGIVLDASNCDAVDKECRSTRSRGANGARWQRSSM